MSSNGSCGVFSNVAVICPVCWLSVSLPGQLDEHAGIGFFGRPGTPPRDSRTGFPVAPREVHDAPFRGVRFASSGVCNLHGPELRRVRAEVDPRLRRFERLRSVNIAVSIARFEIPASERLKSGEADLRLRARFQPARARGFRWRRPRAARA